MEKIKLSEEDYKVFVTALEEDNIEINERFIKTALKHKEVIKNISNAKVECEQITMPESI